MFEVAKDSNGAEASSEVFEVEVIPANCLRPEVDGGGGERVVFAELVEDLAGDKEVNFVVGVLLERPGAKVWNGSK